MLKILFSIFIFLHGFVHLLYFGHSQRYFKLQLGMNWPDQSWILSKFLDVKTIRISCGVFCTIDALFFFCAATGLFFQLSWSEILTIVSCCFLSFTYLLFWNGQLKRLDNQGGICILINIGIMLAYKIFTV